MVREVAFGGWERCLEVTFPSMHLIVTLEVGPRIIDLKTPGGGNIFKQFSSDMGSKGARKWRVYGGHRFWHAPEHPQRTYVADNSAVTWEEIPDGIRIVQKVEDLTGIQKEIDILSGEEDRSVVIKHRLTNRGVWSAKLAPWALSVLKEGSVGFAPLPPFGRHQENLLPKGSVILWAYTKLSDPRIAIGGRLVQVTQDVRAEAPQKIGLTPPCSWIAGFVDKTLFVKTVTLTPYAEYPDNGSSIEFFTNQEMLELETLGPLVTLEPGNDVEHVERWYLSSVEKLPQGEEEREELVLSML